MARILFNHVNPGSYRGEPGPGAASIGVVDAETGVSSVIDCSRFDMAHYDLARQVNWQPALCFADGNRLVLLSMEEGLCHVESTRTHLWVYDMEADTIKPLMEKHRPVPYATAVGLLPGGERIITGHVADGINCHVVSNLDGANASTVPLPDDGFSYCLQPSPDGERVAFHTAVKGGGYRIRVMAWDGSDLIELAGDPDHLFFGPSWSPTGDRLLFTDCRHRTDAEHMRADLCVVHPDGSGFRRLTDDGPHWLSPVYGGPASKGGGSEIPHWMPDGQHATMVRLQPESVTPWPLQENPEVDDHFNRDFRPDLARGGAALCLVHVDTGATTELTEITPGVWDFRATPSADGKRMAFCRSRTGEAAELWLLETDTGTSRYLTAGSTHTGVDHPKWIGTRSG